MSITVALSIAGTGVSTYSRMAEIAANNIANADDEGFVRKDADLAALVRDGRGVGVEVAGILRHANTALARDARREGALSALFDAQAEALQAYALELGQPDERRSVAAALARLEEAFISLAETPESPSLQRQVVVAAKEVAGNLNRLSAAIGRLREQAEADLQTEVQTVNQSLAELHKVNDAIKLHSARGHDVSALEDQRDRLIDTINELIPVREIRRAPNDILLLTAEGVPLFDGRPAQIAFSRTTVIPPGAVYDPNGTAGPGHISVLSGLTVDGRDLAPGSGDAQALTSGRIAGLFAVRDEVMVQFQQQIDQLASGLADRFQDPANDPTLAPGAPGLFTAQGAAHDRTDPADIVGMAARIAVNAAVDPEQGGAAWRVRDGVGAATPGAPGDPAQVFRFLATFGDSLTFPAASGLPASLTLRATGRELVGAQQSARADAASRAERQKVVAQALHDTRLNATGVNVDSELQKMLVIERSYAANANVVQTAARMLDQLLAIA